MLPGTTDGYGATVQTTRASAGSSGPAPVGPNDRRPSRPGANAQSARVVCRRVAQTPAAVAVAPTPDARPGEAGARWSAGSAPGRDRARRLPARSLPPGAL